MFRKFFQLDEPTPMFSEISFIKPQWEYKIIDRTGYTCNISEDMLNGLGREGWELVNCYVYRDTQRFVFKRCEGAAN